MGHARVFRAGVALRLSLAAAGLFWAVCFVGMFQARAQVAVSTVWGCLVFALFFFGTWLHHARLRIAVGDDCVWFRGLRRDVRVVVPGFTDAVHVARHTDLVALVPRSCLGDALEAAPAGAPGVCVFDLPVPTPAITISAIWHPRLDADPAHRWLRDTLGTLCRAAYPEDRPAGGVEACAR